MMKTVRVYLILLAALVLWAGPQGALAASQMANLENALMCKCDDQCGKVLINCTCDTARETRKNLMGKLKSGLTVDQIVQQYVDKYGETVLSAPTKSGFNLSAWIMPFVALLIGGVGVRQVLRAWTRPPKIEADSGEDGDDEAAEETVSGKYSRRLQDELNRLES